MQRPDPGRQDRIDQQGKRLGRALAGVARHFLRAAREPPVNVPVHHLRRLPERGDGAGVIDLDRDAVHAATLNSSSSAW
ncbi:hypothetical protein [Propionivibrio sp.]|uniref:hypothetical protein n=1 Tax=Propionivibrio sp. TaxID=2212460 RepID=UPI0039E6819F